MRRKVNFSVRKKKPSRKRSRRLHKLNKSTHTILRRKKLVFLSLTKITVDDFRKSPELVK